MRKRNQTITIRCTEEERERIVSRASRSNLSLSDFILRTALGRKIIVAEGLTEVIKQQKAIGKNLNQLVMLCNMGRVKAVNLDRLIEQQTLVTEKLCEIAREVK